MKAPYPHSPTPGAHGNGGPPGQDLLGICLAALASVLGTPFVFEFVGPFVEGLVHQAYGWKELAGFMYFASFALTGVVIYAVCRMALWYAIAAIVAFGAVRWSGTLAPMAVF